VGRRRGSSVAGSSLPGRVVLILAVPARPSVFGDLRYDAGAGPFKVGPGAVIGDYEEMVTVRAVEVQKHQGLWEWCVEQRLLPPVWLQPASWLVPKAGD